MTPAALTQFLIDVTRGPLAAAFAADTAAVLCASSLDDDARRAIGEHDVGALWRAGAHPMALLYFARACGWSNERYYACLEDAALTATTPRADGPRRVPAARRRRRRSSARHAR